MLKIKKVNVLKPKGPKGPWALKFYHSVGFCKIYYSHFIFKVMYHCRFSKDPSFHPAYWNAPRTPNGFCFCIGIKFLIWFECHAWNSNTKWNLSVGASLALEEAPNQQQIDPPFSIFRVRKHVWCDTIQGNWKVIRSNIWMISRRIIKYLAFANVISAIFCLK